MGFIDCELLELNQVEATKRRLLAEGRVWVDLASGNPTKHGFIFPEAVLRNAFDRAVRKPRYEPECQGLPEARQAVSRFYNRAVAPEELFITASTSEGYRMLLSLLCEPGESVLVPDITYPLFEFFAADTRVTLIPYRLNPENSWQVESGSLKPTPSTKAIIVVSPNNPTGSIVTDLAPFAALDLPLIVDEVFADFTVGPPVHLQAHHLPVPVFTLNGVSKMFALPGLKLGWIALNRAAAASYGERLGFLNDAYLSASYLVQGMAETLFTEGQAFRQDFVQAVGQNRQSACNATSPIITVLPPAGGASLVCRVCEEVDEEGVVIALLKRGFEVYPGYFFGLDLPGRSHFVISAVAPQEALLQGISALEESVVATTAKKAGAKQREKRY